MSRSLIALLVVVFVSPVFADDKKPEPKGEPVEGTVTYKGQPLPAGTITFVSKDGKVTVAAPIAADGTYRATVPVGEYRVAVSTMELKKADPKNPPKPGDPKEPPKKFVLIPAKYGDPNTSGLTYSVQKGKQVYDIALE
jgi:hypothetical protein